MSIGAGSGQCCLKAADYTGFAVAPGLAAMGPGGNPGDVRCPKIIRACERLTGTGVWPASSKC